jgi:DNA-3-methyladenine glycosylase II
MSRPWKLPPYALSHLRAADPSMARLLTKVGPFTLEVGRGGDPFGVLLKSIVCQQLSNKAAATILKRFINLYDSGNPNQTTPLTPRPEQILVTSEEAIRGCGLSARKVRSLQELAMKVLTGALRLEDFPSMDDDEIIQQVSSVYGLGVWSAQMLLIFELGREDVWPLDDAGVRRALGILYKLEGPCSKAEMLAYGERYQPYRSIASWYLWRLLDQTDTLWLSGKDCQCSTTRSASGTGG